MENAKTFFWITFAFVALFFWTEGVNRIARQLLNIEKAIRETTPH